MKKEKEREDIPTSLPPGKSILFDLEQLAKKGAFGKEMQHALAEEVREPMPSRIASDSEIENTRAYLPLCDLALHLENCLEGDNLREAERLMNAVSGALKDDMQVGRKIDMWELRKMMADAFADFLRGALSDNTDAEKDNAERPDKVS